MDFPGGKKPHILVVEDNASLARFLQLELEHQEYTVDVVTDGYSAVTWATEYDYDLILLDVILPGQDGLSVCRCLRPVSNVPIIMLTARDTLNDRIKGLDTGANDYLCKPFATEELLARIRVQLRSLSGLSRTTLQISDLIIRQDARTVRRGEMDIALTRREFDLLCYLAENTDIVLGREMILSRVWGYDYLGNTNVVDVYIRYLRAKVDDPFPDKLIHTVRGVGYVMREERSNVD